jgi:hypothetical protein
MVVLTSFRVWLARLAAPSGWCVVKDDDEWLGGPSIEEIVTATFRNSTGSLDEHVGRNNALFARLTAEDEK